MSNLLFRRRRLGAWGLGVSLILGPGALGQAADPTPPPGFVALFNGHDLAGWKGLVADPLARRGALFEYSSREALLSTTERRGWVEPDRRLFAG